MAIVDLDPKTQWNTPPSGRGVPHPDNPFTAATEPAADQYHIGGSRPNGPDAASARFLVRNSSICLSSVSHVDEVTCGALCDAW